MRTFCFWVFYPLLLLALTLALGELMARRVFELGLREASRTFQPFFLSGHYFESYKTRDLLESKSGEGPAEVGYRYESNVYVYDPKTTIQSPEERFNWTLRNYLSSYTVDEIDRLTKDRSSNVSIFVLGGSVAMGALASEPDKTWRAVLEQRLRQEFNRSDIYIFNAAVDGFSSTQERLVYELVVDHRNPHMVIDLNGANDAFLPLTRGNRPGDPYQAGRSYADYYDSSLMRFLSKRSNLIRSIYQGNITGSVLEDRTKDILNDSSKAGSLAHSIINVYCGNMERLIKRCKNKDIEALVCLQPLRALSLKEGRGAPVEDIKLASFLEGVYNGIKNRFSASEYKESFVDASNCFTPKARHCMYEDWCHVNDEGNEALAEALFPAVKKSLERILKMQSVNRDGSVRSAKKVNIN